MDVSLFEQFNNSFDVEGLRRDVALSGKREYVDVPIGDYEVAISRLALDKSKAGLPQVQVWFNVLSGEYTGQRIFMYQNVTADFQIKIVNAFLKDLDSGVDVDFYDFVQYGNMIESIFRAVDGHYEYQLAYGENEKGFKTFEIVQKFEK